MRSLLLLLPMCVVSFAACGEGEEKSDKSPPAQAQAQTQTEAKEPRKKSSAKSGREETCLMRGGASGVEQRRKDLWRGFTDGGLVVVRSYGSASEATSVVKAADLIEAEAAGRYAVNGTLKGRGSAEAVSIVADCLRNG